MKCAPDDDVRFVYHVRGLSRYWAPFFLKRLQGQSPLEGPKVLMPGIKTGVVPFRVCNLPQSVLQYPHESGGFYGKNLVCVPRQDIKKILISIAVQQVLIYLFR